MIILNKYIAIGTQLKVERPGKATAVSVCDSLEGPIVKLNDNSVVRVDNEQKAKEFSSNIKEIIFLGDILFSYGDFFNRAHTLAPAGYCEEWWALEVEKSMVNTFGALDYHKLFELTGIDEKLTEKLIKNYFFERPDAKTSITLSKCLDVPLHPYYTYHWKTISRENFIEVIKWLAEAKLDFNGTEVNKIVLPKNEIGKRN
jgi:DNA polymerase II large subunit